jgi:hypothetical protein
MTSSPHERALLPLIGLQGAVVTLGGFLGFFVIGAHDVHAMFRFTALMLTSAMGATLAAYVLGPRLRISGRRLFRLGFLAPGILLLACEPSVAVAALAFGSFVGMTWSARHALEMALLHDGARDRHAARSGTAAIVCGVAATAFAGALLAGGAEQSLLVYRFYGVLCIGTALLAGKSLPHTAPLALEAPFAVMRQPQFVACLPLFFLESGLFGIGQAMASAGAVKALASASQFGWVASAAGLAGGAALYVTRRSRGVDNRGHWLGGACAVVAASFLLLAASAWMPALYIGYAVLKAAGGPFLAASEQVLNQRTLDIRGTLADRIFARELVLWLLRMVSLLLFWAVSSLLAPTPMLVLGSVLLATATASEYLVGRMLFWQHGAAAEQAA